MTAMPHRNYLVVLVACLAIAAGGATVAHRLLRARDGRARATLARFTERDVLVEVALEQTGRPGGSWLRARFTPTHPGFRLYAKELPREGLSGIGRPTLLEIVAGLRAAGPLQADQTPGEIRSDVLGLRFPVYPPGPVTLSLPVTLAPNGAGTVELSVTYMTCSERTCMPPVVDRRVRVTLPARAAS